jgi:hypothetical protein
MVYGLGVSVQRSVFWVFGFEFRVQDFRIGFRITILVKGSGFRVKG